jgi:hypothetical protein
VSDPLSDADRIAMTVPTWEQARAALAAGDVSLGLELLDRSVAQWRSLQDYSINWITSLLSFIGREYGEDAVELALRAAGEEFVRPRRSEGADWAALPASARAKAIARAMLANFGACEVSEDEEKITLSFMCGSGGRMIDEGRYDTAGGPYLTLTEAGPRTFEQAELPVYCAHCSVNNEIQAVEWGGVPTSVEYPSPGPGGRCIHHVYRDPDTAPAEVYIRIGKTPPAGTRATVRVTRQGGENP